MNSIINFYKSLDTFNLILFWGVIIVIILLLSFSIIIANKNRKLKQLLIAKNIENDNKNDPSEDIPIVTNVIEPENNDLEEYNMKEPISIEENNFVAEEHVIDYNENRNTDIIPDNSQYEPTKNNENKLYQRNVLRDISNQTSPIGIVNRTSDTEKTIIKAEELNKSLHEEENQNKNEEYLDEVSRKLSNAMSEIDRTEYELRQEEEAIISFKELMAKKDSIKIVDDENAVISIDELMKKKHEEEKLYNITKDEEDNQFIKELKNFRNDL